MHLPDDLPQDIKSKIMKNRKCVLEKVERYIDRELNKYKNHFFDNRGDDFKELTSKDQILESLEITKFEQALPISENDSFQINLKREPILSFANNYFSDGLLAWEENMACNLCLISRTIYHISVHTHHRLRVNVHML